jgi:hypothetical protein
MSTLAPVKLSPLNLDGIMFHLERPPVPAKAKEKRWRDVEVVIRYLCPVCDEEHESRDDAVECCDDELSDDELEAAEFSDLPFCPVCGEEYENHRAAADCCLWKDLDLPARWKIADAVERGGTWAVELGLGGRTQ